MTQLTYDSSDIYVPTFNRRGVRVRMWGGGGGGGGASLAGDQATGGGGGGGGAWVLGLVPLDKGEAVAVNVGLGGAGGGAGAPGGDGGESWVRSRTPARAAGGKGGKNLPADPLRSGGLGGAVSASVGLRKQKGGSGGQVLTNVVDSGGGGGGSSAGSDDEGANGADGSSTTGGNGGNSPFDGADGGDGAGVSYSGVVTAAQAGTQPGGGGGGGAVSEILTLPTVAPISVSFTRNGCLPHTHNTFDFTVIADIPTVGTFVAPSHYAVADIQITAGDGLQGNSLYQVAAVRNPDYSDSIGILGGALFPTALFGTGGTYHWSLHVHGYIDPSTTASMTVTGHYWVFDQFGQQSTHASLSITVIAG